MTFVPLDVEVPEAYERALVYLTAPQGSIRHVQQNDAVQRLPRLTRDMGLPLGAWVHADSRGFLAVDEGQVLGLGTGNAPRSD